MTINERLFAILEQRNIKDVEIARYLKRPASSISNWRLRGTNPPSELIMLICEFLEISPYYLLTGKEDPETISDLDVLEAFRKAKPETQQIIRKILDIPEEPKLSESVNGKKIS